MVLNPYNQGVFKSLLGEPEVEELFSTERMLANFNAFEVALTRGLFQSGHITRESQDHIVTTIGNFEPDLVRLAIDAQKDGMPVPGYVRQLRERLNNTFAKDFHYGTTSQDLIDTSLVMVLIDLTRIYRIALDHILSSLTELEKQFGQRPLQGFTRMQPAKMISVGDRLRAWQEPLSNSRSNLLYIDKNSRLLQLAGPVGNRDEWGDKAPKIAKLVASDLGLKVSKQGWHTDRTLFCTYSDWCSNVVGILAKIGKDLSLMAQMSQIEFTGGGTSSAMPHKANPIEPEILVAFGHYVPQLTACMHQALMHEQERSGSMWTLEWLVFPQICTLTSKSMKIAGDFLNRISNVK